jgi:single-strand DNA-binding protein
MRYTPDGTPVTNFSVATTEKISKAKVADCPKGWKDSYNGKNWEQTTWFRVTCWRGLAESVNQYVEKGSQLFIEGKMAGEAADGVLNPRVWNGNDGTARASFELTASKVQFLDSKSGNGGAPIGDEPPGLSDDDVLPF